jgi:hypothetical protein
MRGVRLFGQVCTTLLAAGYEVEPLKAKPGEMFHLRCHRELDEIEVALIEKQEGDELHCRLGVKANGDEDDLLELLEPFVIAWAFKEAEALEEMGICLSDPIWCEEEG